MPTLILQPDGTTGLDTTIREASSSANFGVTNILGCGMGSVTNTRQRAQLMFSGLSVLLPTDQIVSASLQCQIRAEADSSTRTIGVHRALTQWFAGIRNGAAPGATDGSTWDLRNANTGGTLAWAGGTGGASGSDWAATATDSATGAGVLNFLTWNVLADVQAWVNSAVPNYGWWFINTTESTASSRKDFGSANNANLVARPMLTVVYTTPGLLSKIMQYGQYSGGTL